MCSRRSGIQKFLNVITLCGSALYVSGTPLSGAEKTRTVEESFKLHRPAFVLPSQRSLGARLFDSQYSETMTQVKRKVSYALSVIILTDSWTNVRGKSLTNFLITQPKTLFYDSVETRNHRHTGEYIA